MTKIYGGEWHSSEGHIDQGHHAISEQPWRKSKKSSHRSSSRRLSNPSSPSTVGKTCWTEKTCVGNRAHSLILETSSAITLQKKICIYFHFMCLRVLPMLACVPCVCLVTKKSQKWAFEPLGLKVWLEPPCRCSDPRSCGRAASALTSIASAPFSFILVLLAGIGIWSCCSFRRTMSRWQVYFILCELNLRLCTEPKQHHNGYTEKQDEFSSQNVVIMQWTQ